MRIAGWALLGCIAAASPVPAGAEAAPDASVLLFSTPHLATLPQGDALRYSHARQSSLTQAIGPDHAGVITLEKGDAASRDEGAVTVVMDAEGAPRVLDQFRGVPGNPILMVFLESTVSAIARATGGSPFYLRNRVREGFRSRLTEAERSPNAPRVLVLTPFQGDRNAHRMGVFEGLQYRFTLSEAAPGMFLSLTATTPEGAAPSYFEEIRLETDP